MIGLYVDRALVRQGCFVTAGCFFVGLMADKREKDAFLTYSHKQWNQYWHEYAHDEAAGDADGDDLCTMKFA